jgi:hypothetical protein
MASEIGIMDAPGPYRGWHRRGDISLGIQRHPWFNWMLPPELHRSYQEVVTDAEQSNPRFADGTR